MIYCVEDDSSIRELTVYALNASNLPALGLECAQELWQQLDEQLSRHQVRFHWVKGHADNAYNNRCDALAVAQTQKYRSLR